MTETSYMLSVWIQMTLPVWPADITASTSTAKVAVTSDSLTDTDTVLTLFNINDEVSGYVNVVVATIVAN